MTLWPDQVTVPSRHDPVVRTASAVIGGPLGRYAVPLARGWRSYAALFAALTAVPMALGALERGHCVEDGWSSPDQFWHMCFSDVSTTFQGQNLAAGLPALLTGSADAPTPGQPPLTAVVMTLLGGLVPPGDLDSRTRFYFGLWAVLATAALALVAWWTAASTRDAPIRAAHVAFSPVVALTALVGPDAFGVALASAALYAWARSRLVWSGVLFGLAVSARSYPLLILLAALFVAMRAGRVRSWAVVAAGAAASYAGVVVVLVVGNPAAAARAYAEWWQSAAGFGSPWVLGQITGHPLPSWLLSGLVLTGWVVAAVLGAFFALAGERRPGVAEVALVMVAVVLVTGKAFPVQASLWLVPLVALCGLWWRDHLLWAGAEAMHFAAVWLYLAGVSVPSRALPAGWYALFVALRIAGVLWLAVQVWRMGRARPPLSAQPDETDQLAGPLRDAPDALVVRVV
ncbi:MAG: glycosyltransferase 87 family protein [Dermatophilaceae bacterium]